MCKAFAMCFFHHTILNISNLGFLYNFRKFCFVVSLSLSLYYILHMISKTIVLKFNPINNFFIYISVKDHGGVFFNPETFGTKTRI